jgi:K+-transporting ATPase KdpF subunit
VAASFWRDERGNVMSAGEIITGLIAVVLLVYLTYALLRPERF